jgi:hypothetical protein
MTTLQEIYNEINAFRGNPSLFRPSCVYDVIPYTNLTIMPELEIASMWQATHQCEPVSHSTCKEWCFMFGGKCDHVNRIKYFTFPSKTVNENEVLVKGPKRPFLHLVKKIGHCNLLLSNDVNSMGGAVFNNLFVLALVWLQ